MDHHNNALKPLIAACLFEKPEGYVIEELFHRFPNSELLNATEEELIQIRGIGMSRAKQITAFLQLAREINKPKTFGIKIRTPKDVFEEMGKEMQFLNKEHFIILMLNTKNNVIAKEVVSMGTLNAAIVHPREVFCTAIKRSSASIVCVHNHPSGDPKPSFEDLTLTNRLVEAGSILGIEVLDHVIIGGNQFYSLKEQGHI